MRALSERGPPLGHGLGHWAVGGTSAETTLGPDRLEKRSLEASVVVSAAEVPRAMERRVFRKALRLFVHGHAF